MRWMLSRQSRFNIVKNGGAAYRSCLDLDKPLEGDEPRGFAEGQLWQIVESIRFPTPL